MPIRVLLLDDNELVLTTLTQLLSSHGYHVEPFSSPLVMLAALRNGTTNPQLIISDLSLPEINGCELLHALRNTRSTLPVIFISGYADTATRKLLLQAGARALLAKPFYFLELEHAILEAVAAGSPAEDKEADYVHGSACRGGSRREIPDF